MYVELEPYKELYQLHMPVISAHNLIIGTPYVDIGGKSKIKNLTTGEICKLLFHKRPWVGTGFKVNGDLYDANGKVQFKLEGRWDKDVSLIDQST